MFPAALDDLIEDDFLGPADRFEEHSRYLDRCRRVRVGPLATAMFENRRTLSFRVQELVRVARATHPDRVRGAMEWYRSLLPGAGRLLASVTFRGRSCPPSHELQAASIYLQAGDHRIPGTVFADAGGDRIIGLVRWVAFRFDTLDHAVFADCSQPVVLVIEATGYEYESEPLDPEARASLLADLGLPADN